MEKLDRINEIRKKYQFSFIAILIASVVFLLIGISVFNPFFFILAFISFIILIIISKAFSKEIEFIKVTIVNNYIHKYFTDAKYDARKGLSAEEIKQSELLKRADSFLSEDLITGSINGINFRSSDLHLEEMVTTSDGKTTHTEYHTFFRGQFYIIDSPKKISDKLLITETKLGTVFSNYNRVKMESIAFNKVFNTYAIKGIDAYYVLTPHLMERILDLEAKNPGKVYISFIYDKLYIGIYNNNDNFSIGLFKPHTDKLINEFTKQLELIKNIVLALNDK